MSLDTEFKGHKVRWMWLFKNIVEQAPYSKMMGAKVENGCIVTWDELVKRMGFTKSEEEVKKLLPKRFDRTWKWLFQECQKIWNGKLNITFADGRPVGIRQEKPGMMWDGEKFVPLPKKTGADE